MRVGISGARCRQIDLHRGAQASSHRPGPEGCRACGGSELVAHRRFHPRRQDENGAPVAIDLGLHPAEPVVGSLGGVAEKTREAMLLCEAFGFEVVIVETVGVGQSETAVAGMTDIFCLLQLPQCRG